MNSAITTKPVICVITFIPQIYDMIKEKCAGFASEVIKIDKDEIGENMDILRTVDILISDPYYSEFWLYDLSKLKFVQGTITGVDQAIKRLKPNVKPHFPMCRYGGKFGIPMSEYLIFQIAGHERKYKALCEAQKEKKFCTDTQMSIRQNSRSLNELTLGVLGMGNIGRHVSKICKAFGITVIGLVTRIPEVKCPYVDSYRTTDELEQLLSECDYICNILPSTQQTQGLLDGNIFQACAKKQSVFINIGRGDICSEETIIQALDNNWLGAAILDVFATEPLPVSSPLWTHEKITITPHVSAVGRPHEMVDFYVRNIQSFLNQKPLEFQVDWDKCY